MIPIDQAQAMLEPLFPGLMGVRLTELSPECVRAEMLVRAFDKAETLRHAALADVRIPLTVTPASRSEARPSCLIAQRPRSLASAGVRGAAPSG